MTRTLCLVAAFIFPALCLPAWATDFVTPTLPSKADLTSSGSNPYFILQPGYCLTLRSDTGKLVVTVLNETRKVDGVECRVVEERESDNGKLVEVSRNYFAISRKDNTVYYFGEDVDVYDKTGTKVQSHEGTWLAGVRGNKPGIIMPGNPKVGDKYYQEVAPKVAMDRAEIVSLTETLKVPAGTMTNVLKTLETSSIESGKEYKYYAKGIGLIKDADMLLVSHGYVK